MESCGKNPKYNSMLQIEKMKKTKNGNNVVHAFTVRVAVSMDSKQLSVSG